MQILNDNIGKINKASQILMGFDKRFLNFMMENTKNKGSSIFPCRVVKNKETTLCWP